MQMPSVQSVPLQQSAVLAHAWPYCAQGGVAVAPAPPVAVVPPEPGVPFEPPALPLWPPAELPPAFWPALPPEPPVVVGGTLHVPRNEPAVVTQLEPRQQSPVMVHAPPDATQLSAPQRKRPSASVTHGRSSQQSAAEAHVSPAARQLSPRPLQRGTPRRSSWHSPEFPGSAQQSLRAEEMSQA